MRGPLGSLGAGRETERCGEGSASGPGRRLRLRDSRRDAFLYPPSQHPPNILPPPSTASCARPVGVGGGVETGRGRVSREGRSEPESVVLRRSEGGKMADRFSRFNEDRDFQVNTGVAEDPSGGLAASLGPPPSRSRGSLSSCCPLRLASRLSFLSLISVGASQPELRPCLRLHHYWRCLLNSGFLPFASACPHSSRPLCGAALWLSRGLCRRRAGPQGRGLGLGRLGPAVFRPGLQNPWIFARPDHPGNLFSVFSL